MSDKNSEGFEDWFLGFKSDGEHEASESLDDKLFDLFALKNLCEFTWNHQQQKIDERDKIIEQLNKRLSEAIDLLYGSSDIPRETIKELLGENEGD